MIKNKFKKAFTLAEILITLTIIGVVASVTVPVVYQDIQDIQFHTAWKRDFYTIDQATKMIMLNNGGSLKNVTYNYSSDFRDAFLQYLNYTTKNCGSSVFGNCWSSIGNISYINGHTLTQTDVTSDFGNPIGVILNNGTFLLFMLSSTTCTGGKLQGADICGYMSVDVNGFNGPNTVGKDIYRIWVLENGVKPFCINGDNSADCTSGYGWENSAKFLYQ